LPARWRCRAASAGWGAVSGGVEGVQPERLRAALAVKEQPCPAHDTVEASVSTVSPDATVCETVAADGAG